MKKEGALKMRFLRHVGIYRSDVSFLLFTPGACPAFRSGRCQGIRTRRKERALLIVRDEFRPAIPRSGCSPALPVSASPARPHYHALPPSAVRTGHFYFAGNRTFLFCVDSPS